MSNDRTMTYVGGPHDGDKKPLRAPAASPWPYESCRRTNGVGAWQHYRHLGDGTYQHEGRCVDIDLNASPRLEAGGFLAQTAPDPAPRREVIECLTSSAPARSRSAVARIVLAAFRSRPAV